MTTTWSTRTRLTAAVVAALIALCASLLTPVQPAQAASYVPIAGAGSTWSYNAIHAWITDVAQNGMQVNYAQVGSTTGRSEFAQGTVDWGASEIPYGVRDGNNYDPPPTTRGYAYMPDTAGGTTFMYNLSIGTQRVTDLRLSGAVIAGIFTDTIKMWNDPKIAADNPGLALPAIRIIPVVRSDGSGATADFTQWMLATQPGAWNAYCSVVGRNPCTQTSAYPTDPTPGAAMVAQSGDLGVSGYVAQAGAEGAIGYVEYSYALLTGFPVAKVLNAAGYYTEPTPGHVAVSLLNAKIDMNANDPLYLTEDLSGVYSDTDPRTYELSAYSYMIIPTNTNLNFSTAKGYTLGDFGKNLLCAGQSQVDALGYSALPINLVEAGYAQLAKIPGANVPTATTAIIQSCNNPTFSSDGTNTLADNDPQPPACDKQGATMCTSATGGAPGSGGASGGDSGTTSTPSPSSGSSSSGAPSSGSSSSGAPSSGSSSSRAPSSGSSSSRSGSSGSTASAGAGSSTSTGNSAAAGSSTSSGSSGSGSSCDANTGICSSAGSGAGAGAGTSAGSGGTGIGTTSQNLPGQSANAEPVAAPTGLGDGSQVALMALAAALLISLGLAPPLIAQATTRRRRQRGEGPPSNPTDWR